MSVVIIDYGSGNLKSAAKAFERASREGGSGQDIRVSDDPDLVRKADRVVLPGVGAFADCRNGLMAVSGMVEALRDAVLDRAVPFLGICVGMQLMATKGFEHGETDGLDWIPGRVEEMKPDDPALKIPHMGWNSLAIVHPHPLLAGLENGPDAYFVHSYQLHCDNPDHVLATTLHGGTVTACVGRDNLFGTQFHPEKSQQVGQTLIRNFLGWTP